MSGAAWTRKEGQDPTGGLNARGRAAYKAATGGTLRPPVKSGDDPRRASFLARMGAVRGPMVKDGKPTRLALALRAWGASSKEDARKKARAISRRLREGNQMKKNPDGAPRSKRLFPSYTLDELYAAVKSPYISEAQRDRLNLAIHQRDKLSQDYVPPFVVPQLKPLIPTRSNPMKRRSNPSSMKSALQLAKNKGWQLLDAGPTNSPSRGLAPFQIVLSETKGYQPFVTHYLNLEDGGFYLGHYFKTYQEAKKDFIERVNETRLRRNPAKRKNTRFFQAKMRTEPLSDYELHLAKQLRTIDPAKLEKMVPAWARSEKIKQFRFVPGAAPVYPAYASGTTISPEKRVFPEYIEGESTDEYARRFYEANKLQFKANPRKRKAKTTPSQITGRAPSARLMRRRAKPRVKGYYANPAGVRIVYNRLLGGWYIVTGPHQSPISGRFDSKEEAQQSLIDKQAARDARAPKYRRNPAQSMFKVLTRSKPSAPFALVGSFKDKSRAMQYARAIHKASPTSLSVKVTT